MVDRPTGIWIALPGVVLRPRPVIFFPIRLSDSQSHHHLTGYFNEPIFWFIFERKDTKITNHDFACIKIKINKLYFSSSVGYGLGATSHRVQTRSRTVQFSADTGNIYKSYLEFGDVQLCGNGSAVQLFLTLCGSWPFIRTVVGFVEMIRFQ